MDSETSHTNENGLHNNPGANLQNDFEYFGF